MPTRTWPPPLVFIVAAVTDWFDGYLARRWNQTSAFGAFLDPVADKLMVAGALLVLVQLDRVDAIIAFIIIGREIAISALREWMAADRRAQVGGRQLARQDQDRRADDRHPDAAVPRLVCAASSTPSCWARCLLCIAGVLTVWSMFYYLRRAWPLIKEKAGA